MMSEAMLWLLLNFFTIVVLAFYSMTEMACVSFNKVRLHYYVSKGIKRAVWLNWLLQHPSRLFGTTLIGVNVAMVAGSECSREFHSAIGLNPDLAPLTQVIIVVILGELAPMFAARHYAEHVGMLGAPLLYASAKLMTPLIWAVSWLSKMVHRLTGGAELQPDLFLSQEELQKILEEQEEEPPPPSEEELNVIAANIFRLRSKDITRTMTHVRHIPMVPSHATIGQVKQLLKKVPVNYIPVFDKHTTNIIGIAFPRDLVRIPDHHLVRDHARPPWFVTQKAKITQILKQFRHNNQSVAVILNRQGIAVGMVNLEDVLEEVFGKGRPPPDTPQTIKTEDFIIIDRSFPGDMPVSDFNDQFGVVLHEEEGLTLSQLMAKLLDHHPSEGESIYLKPFELTVKEASLLEAKTVGIKTRLK